VEARRLVYMANQIGKALRLERDAAAGIEDHIRRFWDPRMRREIAAHLAAGGEGLDPDVRTAVGRLASSV
jgi:formate dehydrogenase subunit delta